MFWSGCSANPNAIENLWSVLKCKAYDGGKQFSSKNCPWESIQSCAAAVDKDAIKTVTDSMNSRLIKLIVANWGNVNY